MATKKAASQLKINDAFLFEKAGKKDIYVATTVDTSKQIFVGTKVSDKSQLALASADQVETIDDVKDFEPPKLGLELLKN